jgi:hypothetical protein
MKHAGWCALGALALAAVVAETSSRAAPGASSPSASAGASASAAPALPTVRGADIPREESKAPEGAEWSQGRRVAATRGSAGRCELTLLREWLRVRCPGLAGVGLVAGDTKGVTMRAVGHAYDDMGADGDATATAVLPLRRGESRIVRLDDLVFEYDTIALGEGGLLSVVWRTGHPDPVLAMYGVRPASAPRLSNF